MSRFITPDKVSDYFDNVVSPTRTNMLHLKQTSVYFEEHCQNFTCYCSKRRIHRFLGQVLLARGYRNIHYLCNICIHLVILCWKWFKKKNARTTIRCKKHYWKKIKRTSSTTTTITVAPPLPRHHLQGHPLQFFRRRNPWTHPLTSHSNLRVWQGNYQKITWKRRKRRTWKIYSQWIHWGTEKVLGENKNV